MGDDFFIVDLRNEWAKRPLITFWRPDNAGYCYPLSWAGIYSRESVEQGGTYYTLFSGRHLVRFAAPRHIVEKLGANPPPRLIDGDAGPVLFNVASVRAHLRRSAFIPEQLMPARRRDA